MSETPVYQSPISLHHSDAILIKQTIDIYGRNENAIFNEETKNFEVQKNIVITLNNKQYKLDEYHFHIPSEHKVNGSMYEAEIHYVFIEYSNEKQKNNNREPCSNICGCRGGHNKDTIVIGRVILNAGPHKDLTNIQVKVPHFYYQYDGTLTTGTYSPVRWIIGETPVHYDLKQIIPIAKLIRPLQKLDGRIILFSETK
jgi:carbonic anhydrase